jgi:uncharacterized protein GlcG (DUF336 family)
MKIPYHVARILVSIAESKALSMNVPMAIAVADRDGGLVSFTRMDDTLPASTELAVSKAYTAAILRMATHEVGTLAQPGEALYGIQHTHHGRIVLFGGGLPLYLRGDIAGSIGISGGSVEEDVAVATCVVDAMEEMEYWSGRITMSLPTKPLGALRSYNLELRLHTLLEGMECDLSADAIVLLTGAVLLAGSESQ